MPLALVTGGAGFIGSHLVRGLLNQGHQVRVLDDLLSGHVENLAELDAELLVGDVRDREQVRRGMEGASWVFHQAALVSVPKSMEDPTGCYEVNLQGTLTVLWEALQAGVKRVVLASSAAVYGDSDRPAAEDAAKRPTSPYAASKLAMEEAALMFHRFHGLPTVCLRYFNVYGPRQRPDSPYAAVIPSFIEAMAGGQAATIYGDGRQRRDLINVLDVVQANLLAAERTDAIGGVFNIGTGRSITILELARILQVLFPDAPAPRFGSEREGDIRFSEPVMERAEQVLGYRPRIDLEAGLRSTVEWFRRYPLSSPS